MISLLHRVKPQICFIMVGFVGLLLLGTSSVQGFCVPRNHQTLVSMSSSSGSWHAPARRVTTRTPRSLSMHMGHSHSHHHHHDHSSSSSSSQHRVLQRHFWRRQVTLLLFCAMVTLGPRLVCNWRNGLACAGGAATTRAAWWAAASSPWTTTMSLSQLFHFRTTDWTAFCVSALALSFAHPIRSELTQLVHKLQATMQQVVKHLPPLQWSNLLGLGSGPAEEEEENEESMTFMAPSPRENRRIQRRSRRRGDPAIRVTLLGVVVNLVLSIGKWVVGVSCHSAALIADAGHSLSDLVSDFVTLFAVQVARLPPDDDHPYGHGKFEALGSLFLALTLLATGLSVGAMSNQTMLQILSSRGSTGTAAAAAATATTAVALPKPPALLMAGVSILSKEWLFRITRVVAQGLNSQVLLANAWHHRSDAYSSILALLSIGLAMFVPGMLAADSFAGLLVAGMICMTGADILGESINQLSDTNNEALVQQVTQIVQEHTTAQQQQEQQTNDTKSSLATHSHGDDSTTTNNHNNRVQVHQVRARQVGSQALVDVKLVTTMEQAQHCSAADTRRLEEEVRHHILTHDSVAHVILDAEVRALPPPQGSGSGPDPWGETSGNKVQAFSVSHAAATTDEQEVVASVEFPSSPVDHHDHDHDHLQNLVDDDSHDNDALKQLIRQQAMSIPDISSVESIALFHENQVAHVVVRVDDSVDRMDQAKISANQLQSTLESWKDIAKAHILIDLTMTTTTTPKDASAHSQSQSHQAPAQQQEEPTLQPQEQR